MPAQTTAKTVTRKVYVTRNPATGELLKEWPAWDDDEALSALALAHEAYLIWRAVPAASRASALARFADLVETHTEELARQTTLEMGKTLRMSKAEVGTVSRIFRYYAEHGPSLLVDEDLRLAGQQRSYIRREPIGVVLGIEPWNVPLYQAMRVAAPNLMLGNSTMVKPAQISAGSTMMLDELFIEAGFPRGAYQTALVSSGQAATLIADNRVRAVSLTGSDAAGAQVAALAGGSIKPVVLELGGSDPFLVLDDADVQTAANVASMCRLFVGGQGCVLPKRMIVTEKVAQEFVDAFVPVFANQVIGDGMDPATTIGPLSSEDAAIELQELYDDAIAKGATVLEGGGRLLDRPGYFFKPAVLADITPEMRLYHEEAFGPLGLIFRVPDTEAAVRLANDTKYGLGATVFSQDVDLALEVAQRIDVGGVGINGYLGAPIEMPFGGTKSSGIGRELGPTGMDAFANMKAYGVTA